MRRTLAIVALFPLALLRGQELVLEGANTLRDAVAPVVQGIRGAVVEVVSDDGDRRVLGTVVRPDGWIVTKASELGNRPKVHFEAEIVTAMVRHVDDANDLAVLQVDRRDLASVALESTPSLATGTLLISAGDGKWPLGVGIVSVPAREIERSKGFLGVQIDDHETGAKVTVVIPGTAAERVGIEVDDIIVEIGAETVKGRDDLIEKIGRNGRGSELMLRLRRGAEELEMAVILGDRQERESEPTRRGSRSRRRGSRYSSRRDGFTRVVQHDTVIRARQCGGPVVDLRGRVVAINIARVARSVTYAIPADVVAAVVDEVVKRRAGAKTVPEGK